MSLHYLVKLEMLIAYVLPLSCYRKKLENLSPLQVWPLHSPDLNPIDNMHGKCRKKRCAKKNIDLELSTTPLTNGYRNDDMTQLNTPFSVAVLVRPSVTRILYTFSCSSPRML